MRLSGVGRSLGEGVMGKKFKSNAPMGNHAIPREMQRHRGTPKSQTRGADKSKTCSLSSIGGLPRKAYTAARGYKLRGYSEFCAFGDKVNRG